MGARRNARRGMRMKNVFPDGVWPVMLTPFTDENSVDYTALEKLTDWYFQNGCSGLFAVCQSSEVFSLSLEERLSIAAFVKKTAKGRPVIASGHISDTETVQVEELKRMADTGVDALILISNRLAGEEESDDILLGRLERIMAELPDTLPLGFYECPYPYKRILSSRVVKFCAESGRFHFLKDTSCDIDNIREKLSILKGSEMKLYNANTATLFESLRAGAAGYSGVMANFHPWLYTWLCDHYDEKPECAEKVSDLLTMCSLIENSNYPVNAKYGLQKLGLGFTLNSRRLSWQALTSAQRMEVEQLLRLSGEMEKYLRKEGKE